jgi:hypothetical protein
LYIDGGRHLTQPEDRITAIEDAFDDVDTAFVEAPSKDDHGLKGTVIDFLTAPVLVCTVYVYVGILKAIEKITGRGDREIVEYLQKEHEAEVVLIDRGFHQLLSDSRELWLIGHTIVILIAVYALPNFTESFAWGPVPFRILVLGLLTGLGLFILFLAGTHPSRNLQMASDIERWANSTDHQNACLVTGFRHVPGISRELERGDSVEIVEK